MSALKVTSYAGRELFPREREWMEAYMQCGNATEASREIGIEKHPSQYGQQMRRKLSDYIQLNMRKLIGNSAPKALETIYEIAKSCPDPKVRLAAAQDLLNRAGYKETQEIQINVKDKSKEELDNEIDALLKRGGIVDAEVID